MRRIMEDVQLLLIVATDGHEEVQLLLENGGIVDISRRDERSAVY